MLPVLSEYMTGEELIERSKAYNIDEESARERTKEILTNLHLEYDELLSLPLDLYYGMETFEKAIFRIAGDIEPESWNRERMSGKQRKNLMMLQRVWGRAGLKMNWKMWRLIQNRPKTLTDTTVGAAA
jgi:hypothetical protein